MDATTGRASAPVPDSFPRAASERVLRHRADGLWDNRVLTDGIEAAAERRPHAAALVDGEGQLSWAQLASEIVQGVATLGTRDIGAGDGVILISGNTRHGVIAYHALLRIGATVAVLDRRCGVADVRDALGVLPARRRVIVSSEEAGRLENGLVAVDTTPLEIFGGEPRPAVLPAAPSTPRAEPDRDRAAVILFSSGTTGRPKGVAHSLNTLTAGASNMARITAADERTVAFLVSPLTSITGLMQVHLAADQHATLALEDRFEPRGTLRRMAAVGATLLGGAPVIAERLLRAASDGANGGVTLRTLALGGAMLPRPLLELATDAFGIEIARVYGSSEAPNFSGSLATDDRERRLSDDGALMPGSELRIGSTRHQREGLLRGPSLFLGYLDAADDSSAFEDGWYRSGDQIEAHRGRLTVVGRLKEVVNRNGLKISLTEIDAALAALPGVEEYASFAMPDPDTGERLAVAVLEADDTAVTLDDVVAHLLSWGIAKRKLPEQLARWDGPLPRTASGKVIRSRLVMESPAKTNDLAARLRRA
ncbi:MULTISPECIES: class I adenylate-forming enzyme family protein [Pseudofrankia]|uniref:class I adenylate-forming enzyme family protein n=1 Tax=Pseudofrankia TaxID=2994363 RepID=UPI000234CD6A|nr:MULTISPECIES: class I adenylate-forming enzyme family protein [Pseudofrankia]OHV32762.1 AMP-dependent synthetase [Pseudofrankia sp. EUN1h]